MAPAVKNGELGDSRLDASLTEVVLRGVRYCSEMFAANRGQRLSRHWPALPRRVQWRAGSIQVFALKLPAQSAKPYAKRGSGEPIDPGGEQVSAKSHGFNECRIFQVWFYFLADAANMCVDTAFDRAGGAGVGH